MPPINSIITILPKLGDAYCTKFSIRVYNIKITEALVSYIFEYY